MCSKLLRGLNDIGQPRAFSQCIQQQVTPQSTMVLRILMLRLPRPNGTREGNLLWLRTLTRVSEARSWLSEHWWKLSACEIYRAFAKMPNCNAGFNFNMFFKLLLLLRGSMSYWHIQVLYFLCFWRESQWDEAQPQLAPVHQLFNCTFTFALSFI